MGWIHAGHAEMVGDSGRWTGGSSSSGPRVPDATPEAVAAVLELVRRWLDSLPVVVCRFAGTQFFNEFRPADPALVSVAALEPNSGCRYLATICVDGALVRVSESLSDAGWEGWEFGHWPRPDEMVEGAHVVSCGRFDCVRHPYTMVLEPVQD